VPIAIRNAGGVITMNPPADRRLEPHDEILIVANDDSTIEFARNRSPRRRRNRCPSGASRSAANAS
jgi:hypothetical protein